MPFDGTDNPDVLHILAFMKGLFGEDGRGWCQFFETDGLGRNCLRGGLKKARRELRIKGDPTARYIRKAIMLSFDDMLISDFNDTAEFKDVLLVLDGARILASCEDSHHWITASAWQE